MQTSLIIGLVLVIAAYVAMFCSLAFTPGKYLYQPRWESLSRLEARGSISGFSQWKNDSGELIGWKRETDHPDCAYLILPGRFGMTLDRTYFFPMLQNFHKGKVNVYLFEYPGFGARGGKSHEKTIVASVCEAAGILKKNKLKVFIIGESLGAAVGAQVCANLPEKIDGLFMVTPFDTLGGVAVYHYPLFPIKPFIAERYDSYQALQKYKGPVYFLLAENDKVSPSILGKKLFESYQGPKKIEVAKNVGHDELNFAPETEYWKKGLEFLTTPTN